MEQGVAQAKFLRHCLVEVNHHVAVGLCDHTVKVGGCQEAIATWVQVGDLGHVPGVIEQDYVSGSQADRPVAGVFVKEVLDQMDYGRVIVMGHAHEPGTYTYNRRAWVACMSSTMTRVPGPIVSCSVKCAPENRPFPRKGLVQNPQGVLLLLGRNFAFIGHLSCDMGIQ